MDDYIVGRNAVREALKGKRALQRILVSDEPARGSLQEIIGIAKDMGVEVRRTPAQQLNKYGKNTPHQGVVAVVSQVAFSTLDEVLTSTEGTPLLVVLDGVEDPHNVGAIIRTAECVGATAVILPKRHGAPINETVAKTSAGAIEHIPIIQIGNVVQTLKSLKEKGFWVMGAHMEGAGLMYETDMTAPLVLVIGNEGKGISRLVKETCDFLVRIPMFGQLNSLNASVAAAVLLYEVVRQRQPKV